MFCFVLFCFDLLFDFGSIVLLLYITFNSHFFISKKITHTAKRTLAHFLLECSQFKSILVQSSGGAQGQFEQRPKTELLLQFLSPKDSLRVALEADAEQEGVQQQEPVNNDDNIL